MKRFRDDDGRLEKFVKSHDTRLMKLDMIAVLSEFERQEELYLCCEVINNQDRYKPDVYLYKDLIIALTKCKKMEEAIKLSESMRKDGLYPDWQTYTEVIRGFLRFGSPADTMTVYENMKPAPDPPDELPFRDNPC
ncbi:hypothetical protein MLD38_011559 [Melastoma candidum]|uniref:Uncharacterized protein n=1 Tax=Melastoma candidum TaxID=119954 RepID=A0ACB9R4K8_9MYRT|nr:hypothetical protein MLD38_011559 [Melastoma candidum]